MIPKLTPNVTDVASFAKAAEDAGADAVSLVNTFLAMAIDVETRRPKITNVLGGLSGPAIRPIAVRMVYECYQLVKIPVIGMGGITDARDAMEFMLAGSTAVQIGTQNFVDPFVWSKVLDGLKDYMTRHNVAKLSDLIGAVRPPAPPKAVHDDTHIPRCPRRRVGGQARHRTGRSTSRFRSAVTRLASSVHRGRTGDGPRADQPRRSRVSRSQVSRHPQHCRGGGAIGGRTGAWMVNVHASGGSAMMQAAEAAGDQAEKLGRRVRW